MKSHGCVYSRAQFVLILLGERETAQKQGFVCTIQFDISDESTVEGVPVFKLYSVHQGEFLSQHLFSQLFSVEFFDFAPSQTYFFRSKPKLKLIESAVLRTLFIV